MKKKIFLILLVFGFQLNVHASELKLGTYKISSVSNDNLLLVENNNNIELGNEQSSGEKLWDVYGGSGGYYIKAHSSNLSLEIKDNIEANGTNIQVNTFNNTSNQKWKLKYVGSGVYSITNLNGSYSLDVSASRFVAGTNIQLFKSKDVNAQKWKFTKTDDDSQILSDGNYIIKGANEPNNVIDLSGGNTSNTSNIWMYSNNNSWAQIWTIKYEDGFYKINTLLSNNSVMDIASANFANYSNIRIYKSNGTIAQKFKIVQNSDNTYSIRSHDGLWSLDINGCSTKSGTNLQIYQPNGSKAQSFYFEKVFISDIETGYYNIESVLGTNKVIGVNNKALTNGKNVDLRDKTDSNYTKWYIKKIERDLYSIANADNTKLVLDVSGNSVKNGANIQLYKSNNTNAQKWFIRKNEDGTYKFIGKTSNKVIDLAGGKNVVGTNVQIYESNNTNAQKFNITPTTVSAYVREYEDGQYTIKHSSGKVIDIKSAGKANGTNVQIYNSNDSKAQVYKVTYDGDGEYIISSLINPKLVLTASSNNVVSSKNLNNDYQKWFFDKDGTSTYIINKATGKYLGLEDTNVVLTTNKTERFTLNAYNKVIKYRGIDVSNHQGDINWASVASSNVDFVIIRAGYAEEKIVNGEDQYEDRRFVKNVEQCEKYNIPYALYLYSYANYVTGNYDSATLEANHMLKLFNKIKAKGYYPTMKTAVYFDQEDSTISSLSKTTLTSMINEFCGTMNNNGHTCGVYSYMNWLNNKINVTSVANKYSIWVAQWPGYSTFDRALSSQSSYTTTSYKLWQFSSDGSVSGVSTRTDMDIGYDIFK